MMKKRWISALLSVLMLVTLLPVTALGATIVAADIVSTARSLTGQYPYLSGGESPSEGGFDCTGLVYYVYHTCLGADMTLSQARSKSRLLALGTKVTNRSDFLPGDVVQFTYSHVAIYIGNGKIIEAAKPGTNVRERTLYSSDTVEYAIRFPFVAQSLASHTITYNANGGYCSVSSVNVPHGGSIANLPTPTRTGYTFIGWYTAGSGGTRVSPTFTFEMNATLYARWISEYPENATPVAFAKWNEHLYFLYDTPATWENAKLFCEQQGGHLAVITSEAENNVIRDLIKRGSRIKYFLGGSDAAVEGQFAWVSGENWSYANWDEGEPNNGTETGQDYLQIYNYDGKYGLWDDVAGTMLDSIWELNTFRGFVMEIDHEHNYDTIWHSDTNYHWHACSCGEIADLAPHTFDNSTCSICGYVDKTAPDDPAPSGGCYVATCVYGSYDCPQVWTLRRFRDETLAKTWYGRAFIHTYYAISPTIVKWFGDTDWFKNMWRGTLDKMVANLNAEGVPDTPYTDIDWT